MTAKKTTFISRWLTLAVVLAGLGSVSSSAQAAFNSNCYSSANTTVNFLMGSWTRSQARSYAAVGIGEGYEWGGGCWNDNGIDDTPGAPDSGGEGGDCSGFTFKSWALIGDGTAGYKYWDKMTNQHGPYNSGAYKAGSGPFTPIAKDYATTDTMDAFASSTHIGMIYSEGTSSNQDMIIEAKGDAYGTNIWTRTYRGDTSYRAVRRNNWSPEKPVAQSPAWLPAVIAYVLN